MLRGPARGFGLAPHWALPPFGSLKHRSRPSVRSGGNGVVLGGNGSETGLGAVKCWSQRLLGRSAREHEERRSQLTELAESTRGAGWSVCSLWPSVREPRSPGPTPPQTSPPRGQTPRAGRCRACCFLQQPKVILQVSGNYIFGVQLKAQFLFISVSFQTSGVPVIGQE